MGTHKDNKDNPLFCSWSTNTPPPPIFLFLFLEIRTGLFSFFFIILAPARGINLAGPKPNLFPNPRGHPVLNYIFAYIVHTRKSGGKRSLFFVNKIYL